MWGHQPDRLNLDTVLYHILCNYQALTRTVTKAQTLKIQRDLGIL